ncbi:MAG: ABC transporter ATP-binding protein [Halofilum sp. (in: g-proteobacteria)]
MSAAVAIRNLHKTYADGHVGLAGIDLTIEAGEFYGLLGENGAGKTTAIGIVSSLVRPGDGDVRVFDHDIRHDAESAKRQIGLVPQEPNFNGYEPVGEIVLTQAAYYGVPPKEARRRARHYLEVLELWDRRGQLARNLSGGLKRRLMIARALIHQPRLLLLDEPTAGVDVSQRHRMWTFLRELNASGTTIVLTTHYLEEAEALCRRVGIIDRGRMLAEDETPSLLRRLQTQTLVLDLAAPCRDLPQLDGVTARAPTPETLELELPHDYAVNEVFAQLSAQGIRVMSLRNKSHRLEELFLRLVGRDSATEAAG